MLADEIGFIYTSNKRIGYLSSELHSMKWSRTQSVDYLVDEGLLSNGYAQAEVTRCTSWPG